MVMYVRVKDFFHRFLYAYVIVILCIMNVLLSVIDHGAPYITSADF